jgi:ATP diphosphatase
MKKIDDLLEIMRRLRNPDGGCPWDVEQDFDSIAPYTIEEAYEVADAIDRKDLDDLKDELGDLLFQVVFHAQMASEQSAFSFDDVVEAVCDKMTRRHPHVFAGERVADAEAQTAAWEEHKSRERNDGDDSALAGVSKGMPEWQRAIKLQKRAARVRFDWPNPKSVIDKIREETEEVSEAIEQDRGKAAIEEEIGDLFFVCLNLTRHLDVDAGRAMRLANSKFERRFRHMESLAKQQNISISESDLEALDALWDSVKLTETKS